MNLPQLKKCLFHIGILFIFVAFIIAINFREITETFEFDSDEGLNLIKAFLYSQGFALYSQIWSDQPPLFTVILSKWFNLFGYSVFASRFLVLLFSALLLWCFYQIIRYEIGKIPALISTILLLSSWLYIRISMSVMIGIPSVSLAMLSIYFITLYKQYFRNLFLIISGGLLALSLQTKLFTLFLTPLIIFYILDFNLQLFSIIKERNKIRILYPVAIWLSTLSLTYLLFSLLYQQLLYPQQLITPHINQPINQEIVNFDNINYLSYMLSQDYDYIFLAIVGIGIILSTKQRKGLFPLAWLGSSIFILLTHKPIWYHHYLLLAIPVCWLAAYTVAFLCNLFSTIWQSRFQSINIKKLIGACCLSVIFICLIVVTPSNPLDNPPKDLPVMESILKYKNHTNLIFTDRPIYAFYTELPVPPEIAVMSYQVFLK